ncbi:MAG: shikimate kinase [Candidatus Bathyarchaeia archaeon]|jgi:shikimate kinase
MTKTATALTHGAATIVNAIATGKGAAVGVDLWTKATVTLTDEPSIIETKITSDVTENPLLAQKTVQQVLRHFGYEKTYGAKVETQSNIPIARGMKSSSAAANAIALATTAVLEHMLDDVSVVKLGVEGALDAKVTITGAFDDACASFFGGVVVTDNLERRIVKRFELTEPLTVLFYVPAKKSYTSSSNVKRLKSVAPLVENAYNAALNGNYWAALTMNGMIYSSAMGYDPCPAVDALVAGAIASGLSGTGPAVAAVVSKEKVEQVKDTWQKLDGEIIDAHVNQEKAKVIA